MKNITDIDNIADIDNIDTNNTDKKDINIKSILVFGNSEQIRNLSNLIYFNNENTFTGISTPFGPSCASFITYPNEMAENTPKDTAFIGPIDPTGNIWFPSDYLSMGIPIEIAMKLYQNIDNSFISKRPEVAFPKR